MTLLNVESRNIEMTDLYSVSQTRDEVINIDLEIKCDFQVIFTNDVFGGGNFSLADSIKSGAASAIPNTLFVIDQGVLDCYPELELQISGYCKKHFSTATTGLFVLPGGEKAKTSMQIEKLHGEMLRLNIDRHAFIVAVGGGAVLDSAGFAASTFHRGVRIIRIPTTVLAQNDAGIGVKNGINDFGFKNLLGCFAPPHAVINDYRWLNTLSRRNYRSGFSEAVKVALIRDYQFFQWIAENTHKLAERDSEACQYLIKQCAILHLNQIRNGGDPFEKGSARPLDYGHWSGHKLEALSNYSLSHGEAVAIGIALDAVYSNKAGLLPIDDVMSILQTLSELGFELYHPALSAESSQGTILLLDGLEEFRQHLGGELCITLLTGLGQAIEVNAINSSIMLKAIETLHDLSRSMNTAV